MAAYSVVGIDETKPANGVPANKADIRGSLLAAKSAIEALRGRIADVRDFGAVGDGSTDDTDAFYDAYSSLPVNIGGGIYVPPGLYNINLEIDQTRKVDIIGAGENSRIQSHAIGGWAINFTAASQFRHSIQNINFRSQNSKDRNGVTVSNGSGVDMFNVRFSRQIIGLQFYETSYGNHYGLWFGNNDIALLFSKKGGSNTNPTVTFANASNDSAFNNLSNKLFFGAQFTTNRVGVFFDYDSCQFMERNIFFGPSFEKHEVAIAANVDGTTAIPDNTIGDDLIQFVGGWFEANAQSDQGNLAIVGTETIFGDTFDRGDIHIKAGRMRFESMQIGRANVEGVATGTFHKCNLFFNGNESFVKRTGTGVVNLEKCRRIVGSSSNNPLNTNTLADVVYPSSRGNPSGFVRPVVHSPTRPLENVKFGDDFTGSSAPTNTSFPNLTPTFQVSAGPFGSAIQISTTDSATETLIIDRGSAAVENYMYLLLLNIQSDADIEVQSIFGNVGLAKVSIEDRLWHTIAAVTYMPAAGAGALPTRTQISFRGNAATILLGGASIIECRGETEIEAILSTGCLPVPI